MKKIEDIIERLKKEHHQEIRKSLLSLTFLFGTMLRKKDSHSGKKGALIKYRGTKMSLAKKYFLSVEGLNQEDPLSLQLQDISVLFVDFKELVTFHMDKEEKILFPILIQLSEGSKDTQSVFGPFGKEIQKEWSQVCDENQTITKILSQMQPFLETKLGVQIPNFPPQIYLQLQTLHTQAQAYVTFEKKVFFEEVKREYPSFL